MATEPQDKRSGGWSRRRFLTAGAVAGAGAVAAVAADHVLQGSLRSGKEAATTATQLSGDNSRLTFGRQTVSFDGPVQAGVTIQPQAHTRLMAFDLVESVDRGAIRRLMRLLTDDARSLMRGVAPLGDSEPELATVPAHLTVTVGVGARLIRVAAGESFVPGWLRPLPTFGIDRLRDEWSGGDLVVEVASDDLVAMSHAARLVTKSIRSLAVARWMQDGFRHAHGTHPEGTSMRNLFGQIDGTVNPVPGTDDFAEVVISRDGWLAGGTSLVVRRIQMDLDTWDDIDRVGREAAVGRRLATGAPLTGTTEHDEPDFDAADSLGFTVIPDFSHMRRARSENRRERIFRRSANYEVMDQHGRPESGQIFMSYQADPVTQFVPIQRRLDELDMLNEWTTPIGSAVFAILPGCGPEGMLGETLF